MNDSLSIIMLLSKSKKLIESKKLENRTICRAYRRIERSYSHSNEWYLYLYLKRSC
jgi:hypothetical protein